MISGITFNNTITRYSAAPIRFGLEQSKVAKLYAKHSHPGFREDHTVGSIAGGDLRHSSLTYVPNRAGDGHYLKIELDIPSKTEPEGVERLKLLAKPDGKFVVSGRVLSVGQRRALLEEAVDYFLGETK